MVLGVQALRPRAPGAGRGGRGGGRRTATLVSRIPWWLVALGLLGLGGFATALLSPDAAVIFRALAGGIPVTLGVAFVAFVLATALGLGLGLLRSSALRLAREVATFYIELVRGLPMLVILYYIAFVGAPALATALNALLSPLIAAGLMQPVLARSFDFATRAVLALTLGYAAFIAEIFRAGIESVDRGQVEAGLALGLSRGQVMRRIILPQALRNILPALGNEFVAVIKDSALVSALGVQDLTQLGKVYSASTFRFFETYNVVAFFYLCLTVSLSLLVKRLERRLKEGQAR